MSFDKELSRAVVKLKDYSANQVKGSLFAITGRTIKETPVDEGRLINNWQTSINRPMSGTVSGVDPSGSAATRKAQAVINKMEMGDTLYFTNNLPYAARIEYEGWSKLAPAGMLRVNVERVRASLARR